MHHPPFGHVHSVIIAPPGAATDFAQAVPAGAIWKLHSVSFQFATDANVIDRYMVLSITDGTFILGRYPCQLAQAASDTVLYTASAAPADDNLGPSGFRCMPIHPDLWLPAGFTIESAVVNIQAGDAINIVHFVVEEWMQP